MSVSRSSCCCSAGVAWGQQCQECPVKGSEEFRRICPGGDGFQPNRLVNKLMCISKSFRLLLLQGRPDLGGRERVRPPPRPVRQREVLKHLRRLHVLVRQRLHALGGRGDVPGRGRVCRGSIGVWGRRLRQHGRGI